MKKPGGTAVSQWFARIKDGSAKKSGTKRIWQMDESENRVVRLTVQRVQIPKHHVVVAAIADKNI